MFTRNLSQKCWKSHGQVFFLNFAMYHEQRFPCFFQVQENSWTWRTQVSWYWKSQNILLRIPLKLFWSIIWLKSSWNLVFLFRMQSWLSDQMYGKTVFPSFFFQPLLKENQKYEQKLWPKNQGVNAYSQEMCAGTNKHVIGWDNQPHMCTGFLTPSRSTWPLDVESTPQAIVSIMRVCDSESSKRCDWWRRLHRVLTSCGIWITWISSQNNLSKYRQRQQTGSSETKVRSKNWSKNNRVKIQT